MKKSGNKIHYLDFGKFRLDITNRELLKGGSHVPLTQKSFELLEFLIQNRGRGLRKNEILNGIWTENFVEEANLAQHIYMVRKALKDNGDSEEFIETIPKYGYKFIGDVSEEFAEAIPLHISSDQEKPSPEDINENHSSALSVTAPSGEISQLHISAASGDPIAIEQRTPTTSNSRVIKLLAFAFAFVALVSVVAYFLYSAGEPESDVSEIRSIAILPFSQIGGGADEKLGLGIADSLISKLGNQKEISVSPTSTIVKFLEKGTDNAIEIGEKLNVDAVLTGTIQRENDIVRVNVQLISVKDKTPTWSDKFDSKFSNIFALQDKISEQVATRLSLKLQEPTLVEKNNKYTENIEAYQAYTIGLYYYDQRSEVNLPKAIEQFEKAIKNDPKFAPAYALAADSYSLIAYYKFNSMPETEAIAKARQLANKALELDPRSSEALTALGLVALYDKSPEEAGSLYRRAIEIKPNNTAARLRLAVMLTLNETLDEAIGELRLAQKADPTSMVANQTLTRLLRLARDPDEALIFCRKALEIDPQSASARSYLAEIFEQKGDYDKAAEQLDSLLKESPDDPEFNLLQSRVAAKSDDRNRARNFLQEGLKNKKPDEFTYELSTAYLFLGEKAKAIEVLRNAKENTLIYYIHLKFDSNLDEVRKTQEFQPILEAAKLRLDPSYK